LALRTDNSEGIITFAQDWSACGLTWERRVLVWLVYFAWYRWMNWIC
jgi:hypothetical protein